MRIAALNEINLILHHTSKASTGFYGFKVEAQNCETQSRKNQIDIFD